MNRSLNRYFARSLSIVIGAASYVFANLASADTSVSIHFSAEIEPVACRVSIDSAVDYGEIAQSKLSDTHFTALSHRALPPISVECDAKTALGFRATDNRSGIAADAKLTGSSGTVIPPEHHFSLGRTYDGRPIGAWGVIFSSGTVDGRTAWITGASTEPFHAAHTLNPKGKVAQWMENGTLAMGKTFTLQGEVVAGIAKKSELPSGDIIVLDGMATLEIVYL
ncbi:Protein of uncharacterised function (DUF1120) [Yersinia nurmii]|uniref:Protein of uncharacterized function (DUF1120) n=1 Tax=Yersinia nurmii TaxID=685706 RepID=A0ABP1YGK1_9GAMM|nr:DUF1120 domain-containing protein [Yersinia nurmii]CNE77763.1 Protein of uncharacterised function (DUF1120) [Yersinia nurmii]